METQEAPSFVPEQISEFDLGSRVILSPRETAALDDHRYAIQDHFRKTRRELPAFPAMATRVLKLVESPDVDIHELVKLINHDPSITTHVLRVANSAFYSRGAEAETVRESVVRLGLKEVANIAASASIAALFDKEMKAGHAMLAPHWKALWERSITAAYASSWLALAVRRGRAERSFLAGLLHDIGKVSVLRSLSALIARKKIPETLRAPEIWWLIEALHVDFGGVLVVTWDLPQYVAAVCLDHHSEEIDVDPDTDDMQVVRVTSGLNEIRTNPWYAPNAIREVSYSAEALGLTNDKLAEVIAHIPKFAEQATAMFPGAS